MRYLRTSDLKVGLEDLFRNRLAALQRSSMGASYEPLLRARYNSILELPPALTGAPLADQLAEADAEHDGYGLALFHMANAYLEAPDSSEALRAAATRVLETLVPSRAVLRQRYTEEISRGQTNAASLEKLGPDLEAMPVAGGKTLASWGGAFVEAAARLGTLLGQRADADSPADAEERKQAGRLRSQTLGLLNQLREAVRQEVELNTALPRDLEAQIFNYFDTLEAMRAPSGGSSESESAASGSGEATSASTEGG